RVRVFPRFLPGLVGRRTVSAPWLTSRAADRTAGAEKGACPDARWFRPRCSLREATAAVLRAHMPRPLFRRAHPRAGRWEAGLALPARACGRALRVAASILEAQGRLFGQGSTAVDRATPGIVSAEHSPQSLSYGRAAPHPGGVPSKRHYRYSLQRP